MLSVDEALVIVRDHARALDSESVDFTRACGRLLREDVRSDSELPPFPRSAVDGYAIRAADVATVPARLRIVGEVPAGTFPDFAVERGEAAQIMTGAPVPEGADAVQMVERTRSSQGIVELLEGIAAGANIAPRGSEVGKNDIVLRSGTRLDPAAIAVAATVGKTTIRVGRKPTAGVIATGDELVPPSQTPAPGQIRNSNGYALSAQCARAGADVRSLGVAEDNEASLQALIREGLTADVLLLSGGVSMGRFDLVEGVLDKEGVEIFFESVALKPGKPLVFGRGANGTLVFGLPGNPVSTAVTFELFVRPTLARLEGALSPERPLLRATLRGELRNRGPRRAFLPGWIATAKDGTLTAQPIPTRGSGDIVAFAKSNALLIAPEALDAVPEGERIDTYPLDGFFDKEDRWQIGPNPN